MQFEESQRERRGQKSLTAMWSSECTVGAKTLLAHEARPLPRLINLAGDVLTIRTK